MKKKYLIMAVAALTFAACSNENDITEDNGPVAAEVKADISGRVQTRASGTEWGTSDAIGVSVTSTGLTKGTNVKYSRYGEGFKAESPIYFQNLDEVTFSAYYPYNEAGGTISKTITADDQSGENQPKIDYMFASGATASKASPTVSFTGTDADAANDHRFHHKMAKLDLTFNKGADTDLQKMTGFTVSNLKMAGTFNTTDGEAKVTDDATATDLTITETPSESDTYTRSLILFPQTVDSKKFSISITLDGQTYKAELTIPGGKEALESGNKYSYTITVNKT